MEIKKVAVVGGGTMGNQIAMQVAISGYQVSCYDISAETIVKAIAFTKQWFEKIQRPKVFEKIFNDFHLSYFKSITEPKMKQRSEPER